MQALKTVKTLSLIPALLIAGAVMAQTPAAPAATAAPAPAKTEAKAEAKTEAKAEGTTEKKASKHKAGTKHHKAEKPAAKASEAAK